MIAANQLQDLVEFKGWVTGAQKKALLQQADVFVLPSYYEGVPVAILEAMSYGKPIIATPVGGIPEIVQSGMNGWLHQPGDQAALLNAIRHYIDQPQSIQTHGAWSGKMIQDYYPGSIMPQLEGIYRSLL
jgi:glycosyltransferase involved in cell wall biosynthesis